MVAQGGGAELSYATKKNLKIKYAQKALRCEGGGGGTPFGKFTEVRIKSRRLGS